MLFYSSVLHSCTCIISMHFWYYLPWYMYLECARSTENACVTDASSRGTCLHAWVKFEASGVMFPKPCSCALKSGPDIEGSVTIDNVRQAYLKSTLRSRIINYMYGTWVADAGQVVAALRFSENKFMQILRAPNWYRIRTLQSSVLSAGLSAC